MLSLAQTAGPGRLRRQQRLHLLALEDRTRDPVVAISGRRHHRALPTGASKRNLIEHRLFSEISKNWAAEPLDSYEKMLKFIRTTRTQTGLAVTAYLDRNEYPTRLKPDPQLISSLRLSYGKILPRWNYTIRPNL